MQIHTQLSELPEFKNPAITIGSFDGVHAGHLTLLKELKSQAQRIGGESVVITFEPHPRTIFSKNEDFVILSTLPEKIKLLQQTGIDHLCVVPFDIAFAGQSPENYLENFLATQFKPACIVIGYDHRFGKGRLGDIEQMKLFFAGSKVEIVEIDPVLIRDIAISSTRIRNALFAGDLQEVNALSTHPYLVAGDVISGDQIGRTLGFPTANLALREIKKALPVVGIYAATAEVDQRIIKGMAYIGNRPVIGTNLKKVIEINLFDFNDDIYGKTIYIWFNSFLRNDIHFSNLSELKVQLEKDKAASMNYFNQQLHQA